MGFYHTLAVVLAITATVLAALAIAVFEGYMPADLVGNLTPGELGVFSALAVIAAIGARAEERA